MHKLIGSCLAAASALALSALPAAGHKPGEEAEGPASLHVRQIEDVGDVLVDDEGISLYLFEADTQGKDGSEPQSACHEKCAEAWPPLLTEGEPEAHDEFDAELLGTIEREDGETQVTYAGWPLYYYAADQSPGHARGHDIEDHGAEWYLVTPEGEKAGEEH
jgi:predicted lipoprotein with Yx(FWY)xxD motif